MTSLGRWTLRLALALCGAGAGYAVVDAGRAGLAVVALYGVGVWIARREPT